MNRGASSGLPIRNQKKYQCFVNQIRVAQFNVERQDPTCARNARGADACVPTYIYIYIYI